MFLEVLVEYNVVRGVSAGERKLQVQVCSPIDFCRQYFLRADVS
jgi:hypothetical protein